MSRRVLVASLFLTSCAVTADELYCQAEDNGVVTSCIDIYNVESSLFSAALLRPSLAILCAVTGGETTEGTCPDEGKVAGCAGTEQDKYDYTEWTYEDADTTDPSQVSCSGSDTKVDPAGNPI